MPQHRLTNWDDAKTSSIGASNALTNSVERNLPIIQEAQEFGRHAHLLLIEMASTLEMSPLLGEYNPPPPDESSLPLFQFQNFLLPRNGESRNVEARVEVSEGRSTQDTHSCHRIQHAIDLNECILTAHRVTVTAIASSLFR